MWPHDTSAQHFFKKKEYPLTRPDPFRSALTLPLVGDERGVQKEQRDRQQGDEDE
jgi:hypothetical protein